MTKKKTLLMILLALSMLVLVSCRTAEGMKDDAEEMVDDMKDFVTMSADEVQDFMSSGEDYYILDTRDEDSYNQGHIKDAVRIQSDDFDTELERNFKEKDRPILVYGNSSDESQAAARKLHDRGYSDVREFGAMKDWPYQVER